METYFNFFDNDDFLEEKYRYVDTGYPLPKEILDILDTVRDRIIQLEFDF